MALRATSLEGLLQDRKETLHERWLDKTLNTYRGETPCFLRRQGNPFANPVGQSLDARTRSILDNILNDGDAKDLCADLEEILKFRAIQGFLPSEAIGFVLLLKDSLRETLEDDLDAPDVQAELREVERRIDQATLFAFDIFTKCRESVYELRLTELRERGWAHSENRMLTSRAP